MGWTCAKVPVVERSHAANLVDLSEQVPGRITFLTEGPSRKIKIGNQEIVFKKATKKVMSSAGTREGLLIQALKNLGKDHIDQSARIQIAKFLKNSSEKKCSELFQIIPLFIILFSLLS